MPGYNACLHVDRLERFFARLLHNFNDCLSILFL